MNHLYSVFKKYPQVFIDTRKDLSDAMFFAVGQKDDKGVHRGNQFAEAAINSGKAAFAVINDPQLKNKYSNDNRYILVEDGEKSLQQLAAFHRTQLKLPFLAIAGSNGKTTVKELLQAVLSSKLKTFSTQGNLNNHLGVPLSLLSVDDSFDIALIEIGANHLEETRFLAEIIQPDFGLITNCGKDHLGEYGSVANIIKANKELYDVLSETNKTAFVSCNDELLVEMSSHVQNRLFYGQGKNIRAEILDTPFLEIKLFDDQNSIDIQSNLFGRFWLDALLGAAAVGLNRGVELKEIKEAIENYQPAALRSQLVKGQDNKILLDCYNANPSSMEVFLKEIQQSSMQDSKILVLGEMLELGKFSQYEHQKLINSINPELYDDIIVIGDEFLKTELHEIKNLRHFLSREETEVYLHRQNYKDKYFFVKGSRGNRLELLMQMYL